MALDQWKADWSKALSLLLDHVDDDCVALWAEVVSSIDGHELPAVLGEIAESADAMASHALHDGDLAAGEALASVARATNLLRWSLVHQSRGEDIVAVGFVVRAIVHFEGTENENAGRGKPVIRPTSGRVAPLH